MLNIDTNARIHHATRAKAERLFDLLVAEYPVLSLGVSYNEDVSKVTGFFVAYDVEGEVSDAPVTVLESPKVPELADIFAACEDMGLDPEAIEAEEVVGGSVVPETYRAAYKAQKNTAGQTCGDWTAIWLEDVCHGEDGFSIPAFEEVLRRNEVDQSGAWARLPESGQKGWIGRWRMNGRQQLEKVFAVTGVAIDADGGKTDLPEGELMALQRKHEKFLAKLAKEEAKREAA